MELYVFDVYGSIKVVCLEPSPGRSFFSLFSFPSRSFSRGGCRVAQPIDFVGMIGRLLECPTTAGRRSFGLLGVELESFEVFIVSGIGSNPWDMTG